MLERLDHVAAVIGNATGSGQGSSDRGMARGITAVVAIRVMAATSDIDTHLHRRKPNRHLR